MDISAKTLDAVSKKIAGKFKGRFKTQTTKPVVINQPKVETVAALTTIVPEAVVEVTPEVIPATVETAVIDVVNTPELVPTPSIDENATAVQLINNTEQ
jgi:hypothetical protein